MRALFALALTLLFALPARAEINIQEVQSPGGLNAWLVEETSIPFVALEIRFRGGTSLDLPGKRGATNLMVGLLEEGAADLDARGFAAATESIAASLGFDVGDDTLSVSARFLTETQDEAMALLRSALLEPRFDQDAIDRVRAQVISGIRSDLKDPDEIVGTSFFADVFEGHPYATTDQGTEDSVTALTRDDILTAWRNAMALDRVYVSAAGDISAEELGALMDELFAGLPETGPTLPEPIEVATQAGVTVVPFETPQSVALFGHRGLDRKDPDFIAAYVLNEILGGGGFEARLMTEVREKRGLTYGIYSYLSAMDGGELVLGKVASANDRIAEAIDVIRTEWERMASEGPSEQELEDVKTYLTGAYPLRFDGNARIARILVGMQMDDLGIDYITTRNPKIEALTVDDMRRVAQRLLQPGELKFVVVGQPEGLDTPGQ